MKLTELFKKKSKTQKRETGDRGEQLACEFLIKHGYEIIARNTQVSHKEIDIVAENDEYTVIVEVKSLSKSFANAQADKTRPSDNIDYAKMQNLLCAARYWKNKHYTGRCVRIDVIEVYLCDLPPKIVHIEDAVNKLTLYRKRR